ncbi:aspartyl-phosphate phosphatase Spo0E family protein [Halobacillus sp. A1]|uniref:aspartyl-phosphate phosphatase Spo0E family protein n=1 Tax=Halobacillus sp. A1 TaxID=2880262 RepID=UPI0021146BD8|nr:aspartyl-phosphate phosphatase Spo0E family protein [Halobacillus sp. A1]MCP3032884.1 aspartyl-phosphate phosphatase Spo0E family protein [Halobacillus sp. A1]
MNEEIEVLRKKMYETYENNPNDSQILVISQALDKLLNELELAVKNKKDSKE